MAANRADSYVNDDWQQILHEGACVKESGTRFMGQHNWQKRWFRLGIQRDDKPILAYYKNRSDKQPVGAVHLDGSYCSRPVERTEKSKPFCFAVGPLIEDGFKRTYFISCESEQHKLEWMEVIDAAIEGVPEEASERRQAAAKQYTESLRANSTPPSLCQGPVESDFANPHWQLQKWTEINDLANSSDVWSKVDVKHGVTVARGSFGGEKDRCVLIKVEGLIRTSLFTMYRFLQQSIRQGGKLDYPFRNEKVLQDLEAGELQGSVFASEYSVPWPRISPRDICAMRIWVPDTSSLPPYSGTCGFLLHSVDCPSAPEQKDVFRVQLGPSGIVLKQHVDASGEQTQLTLILQINTRSSLQKMLKGAYKSGPLKLAFRSGFQHIVEQIERYHQVLGI